jgi:Domain of unknown function (DUF4189)
MSKAVLVLLPIAIRAAAADYAPPGFLGEACGFCNLNEVALEGSGSKNVPGDSYISLVGGSATMSWPCKDTRERTGCLESSRFVPAMCGTARIFRIQFYTSRTEVADAPPPVKPWAAVAISDAGRWGISIMSEGPDIAVSDALKQCGSGCRIVAQGPGRCVAVALSKAGSVKFGYSYGADRNEVESFAMRGCTARAPEETCRLKHVKCL